MTDKEEIQEKKDVPPVYCDVCGINMTVKECSVIGASINIQGDHKEIQRVKDAFGKTDFKICYVCCLRSLGVKER